MHSTMHTSGATNLADRALDCEGLDRRGPESTPVLAAERTRAEPRRLQGAILAVLGDAFMARWREALEGYYAEHPDLERTAIPWGERPARIAALEATLRALEIQEEKSILKAASYGIRIDRREDMDVAVLFDPAVLEETTP